MAKKEDLVTISESLLDRYSPNLIMGNNRNDETEITVGGFNPQKDPEVFLNMVAILTGLARSVAMGQMGLSEDKFWEELRVASEEAELDEERTYSQMKEETPRKKGKVIHFPTPKR
jgi:hypothetical protein